MRLTRVEIGGYLSIKNKLDLPIDPNVTVLLGPNDHGKSNVLSAIGRLQDISPLREQERNWDLPDSKAPWLHFHFRLEGNERKRVLESARRKAAPDALKLAEADIPERFLVRYTKDDGNEVLNVKRGEVIAALVATLPSVEFFEPFDSIPDSVTADTINDEEHEFMKGIFMYAGVPDHEWPWLFKQTDKSLARLERASRTLNRTIRDDWSQGQGLNFQLRHDSQTESITLRIKDPAVSSRWVRASEKSSGFTHYFSLRTRMYARSGGHPDGSADTQAYRGQLRPLSR